MGGKIDGHLNPPGQRINLDFGEMRGKRAGIGRSAMGLRGDRHRGVARCQPFCQIGQGDARLGRSHIAMPQRQVLRRGVQRKRCSIPDCLIQRKGCPAHVLADDIGHPAGAGSQIIDASVGVGREHTYIVQLKAQHLGGDLRQRCV